jgi:hypothetical protein
MNGGVDACNDDVVCMPCAKLSLIELITTMLTLSILISKASQA